MISHLNNTNYSTRLFIDIGYGILVIEIGRIRLSMDTRLPRRRDFLSFQSFPIDSRKERMLFHLHGDPSSFPTSSASLGPPPSRV